MASKSAAKQEKANVSAEAQRHIDSEQGKGKGALLSDVILGGQDGLVNVWHIREGGKGTGSEWEVKGVAP